LQGIVDESNPYDKLQLTATLPSSDPLFRAKRDALDAAGLATMQVCLFVCVPCLVWVSWVDKNALACLFRCNNNSTSTQNQKPTTPKKTKNRRLT
jgi:hypothetical protein